jgi:formylglycine-generating enzyme required for sulfatase activity
VKANGARCPNQPVVGVNWFEAMAYATTFGARLPYRLERSQIVRGEARRPYPWGEPFGTGRANTREEVVNRTSAVGLFRGDVTPEGVYDLAGNVGEWTLDGTGDKRVYHPGSWRQPSMAAWAKALAIRPPDGRGDDLGFRLVADLS